MPISSEDNIQAVRRLLDAAFSNGELAVIDEIAALDAIEHQNGTQGTGAEAVRRIATGLRASFPNLTLDVEDIAAVDDKVWVRARARGTDTGGVAGRPPSGKAIEVDVVDVVRFRGGKIVEHWGVADRLGMLQQVGVLPLPPQQERRDA
jgi:predicted ester cyclase